MFSKIVVGIDGTPGDQDALALAHAVAGEDAALILVHAFPLGAYPRLALVDGYEESLRQESSELLHKAAEGEDAADVRSVNDTSPARALHHVAEDEDADLIVVGSCHHQHALGRVLLGDTSRATLNGAPCPVAVAPRGLAERPATIHMIGVGYTDTDESRVALSVAREIAIEKHAALRVRTATAVPTAFSPGYAYSFDWVGLEKDFERLAKENLAEATADLGVPVITEACPGLVNSELRGLAEIVDLLVVGSRGWGATRRVLLGSTANSLAHSAQCPLIVVQRPAGDRAAVPEAAAHRAPS